MSHDIFSLMTSLIDALKKELGEKTVLTEISEDDRHLADWSGDSASSPPPAIIRPANTEELSVLLKHCHEAQQAVAIQGGLTGLSAGAIPDNGELAV
jgi:FAD/FMN-containing dehydrogenase